MTELADTVAAYWEPLMRWFAEDLFSQIRFEETFVSSALAGDDLPGGTVLTIEPDRRPGASAAAWLSSDGVIRLQGNMIRDARECESDAECQCDDHHSALCCGFAWQCVQQTCLVVAP